MRCVRKVQLGRDGHTLSQNRIDLSSINGYVTDSSFLIKVRVVFSGCLEFIPFRRSAHDMLLSHLKVFTSLKYEAFTTVRIGLVFSFLADQPGGSGTHVDPYSVARLAAIPDGPPHTVARQLQRDHRVD